MLLITDQMTGSQHTVMTVPFGSLWPWGSHTLVGSVALVINVSSVRGPAVESTRAGRSAPGLIH